MNKKEISEYFSKMGKKGAKSRLKTLTVEQRSEIAKNAAAARWKDKATGEEVAVPIKKPAKKAPAKKVARKVAKSPKVDQE